MSPNEMNGCPTCLSTHLPTRLPVHTLPLHSLRMTGGSHKASQTYCKSQQASHVFWGNVFGGGPDGSGGIFSVGCLHSVFSLHFPALPSS